MTVRANFKDVNNNHIIHHQMLGYNGQTLQGQSQIVDGFLTRNRHDKLSRDTEVLFLELHGQTRSVLQLYTELQRWRRMSIQHDTGFFAWTLVREPVSFSVSYFNFFWAAPCLFDSGCPYKLYAPTQVNFRFTAKANVQCLYWSRSDVTWRSFKETHDQSDPSRVAWPVATETECQAVSQVLLSEMDWVGTTDKLSQETLPLLAFMLSSSSAVVDLQTIEPEEEERQAVADDASTVITAAVTVTDDKRSKNTNKKNEVAVFNSVAAQKEAVITVESLRSSTVDYIRSINTYDQAIYDAVVKEFTMDMWEDWVA
jgi:hypothetical protein